MPTTTPSRVLRSKEEARAAYDRLSRFYSLLAASEAPLRKRALDMLAAQRGERLLEIGCGPGETLEGLARAGARTWGIDLSPGMARAALRRLAQAGLGGQVGVQVGDALRLPYPARCFDGVLMAFTLELFDTPEIPLALAEVRRVLRPGGRLCVAAMALAERPNGMVGAYEWFHARFPAWVDCRPIPLRRMMVEAGYHPAESWQGSTWGLPVEICVGK
jgi:ubiquinone/menaquinone biosynthesis C-methylase UbiE